MGAFFSGTDDNDDRGNCYVSGVIGKLSTTCEMVFRFNLPGNMKINPLPMDMIFEYEQEPQVPAEWLAQVKKQVYVAPVTRGYTVNTGGAAGGNYGGRGAAVGNPNFPGNNGRLALEQLGLSGDDEKLLEEFGYPFPYSGTAEGSDLPFPQRPQALGRKTRNSRKNKVVLDGSTRLPRKVK